MLTPEQLHAAMRCPNCEATVVPQPSSTLVLAWYECPTCHLEWSARLRDGRPATVLNDWDYETQRWDGISPMLKSARRQGFVEIKTEEVMDPEAPP